MAEHRSERAGDETEADDGAVHAFYEWLRAHRSTVDLEHMGRPAFLGLIKRFDDGGAP